METQTITYRVQLRAIMNESLGYISYVFENLNFQHYDYQYITAVRFPNWDHGPIEDGAIGYVVVKYVQGGVDEWYDKDLKKFQVYNNDNIIFLKFIPEKPEIKPTEIILD